MKQFLVKILFFLGFTLFYFFGNMIINYYIYSSESPVIENSSILISGDSHTQKSLNPKLFDNAQNISQSAEPYIVTYWKLKNIFKIYQPDTLILGFAQHNIAKFNDHKFSDEKWSSEMFKRTYTIQEFKTIENVVDINFYNFYKTLWKQTAFYPKKTHTNYLGEYSNNRSDNVANWESAIRRHFYYNGKTNEVSMIAIDYLDSIINLCRKKEIAVVLASNPVSEQYLDNIPLSIMAKFNALKNKYKDGVIIFDKTSDSTYSDSLFLDADHLNEYGAKKFTSELRMFLKNEFSIYNKAN